MHNLQTPVTNVQDTQRHAMPPTQRKHRHTRHSKVVVEPILASNPSPSCSCISHRLVFVLTAFSQVFSYVNSAPAVAGYSAPPPTKVQSSGPGMAGVAAAAVGGAAVGAMMSRHHHRRHSPLRVVAPMAAAAVGASMASHNPPRVIPFGNMPTTHKSEQHDYWGFCGQQDTRQAHSQMMHPFMEKCRSVSKQSVGLKNSDGPLF